MGDLPNGHAYPAKRRKRGDESKVNGRTGRRVPRPARLLARFVYMTAFNSSARCLAKRIRQSPADHRRRRAPGVRFGSAWQCASR